MPDPEPKPASRLLAYAQLFRLPNLFTAAAGVTMGYLVVHTSLAPAGMFVCLLAASCLLYTAGMVLNDVYDLEIDARDRPHRPLPSGRISPTWAKWLGYEMLLLGLALGWLAGYLYTGAAAMPWRSGAVATLLVVCILLYDIVLKRTLVAPVLMGACRMLNVLLGMSLAPRVAEAPQWNLVGFDAAQLLIAGGIGLYVVGVTWFARTEAVESRSLPLTLATGVMAAGIVLLAIFPRYTGDGGPLPQITERTSQLLMLLLLLISVTILRRCLTTAFSPTPQRVQTAVGQCLLSLIVLDAAVVLAVLSPAWWAIGVLALVAPVLLLRWWIYST